MEMSVDVSNGSYQQFQLNQFNIKIILFVSFFIMAVKSFDFVVS